MFGISRVAEYGGRVNVLKNGLRSLKVPVSANDRFPTCALGGLDEALGEIKMVAAQSFERLVDQKKLGQRDNSPARAGSTNRES